LCRITFKKLARKDWSKEGKKDGLFGNVTSTDWLALGCGVAYS